MGNKRLKLCWPLDKNKMSLVSGHRSASKLVRWRIFFFFWGGGPIFFLPTSVIDDKCYKRLLEPDQISHTQSMTAKRGRTNQENVHTPRQNSNQIPAILAAIGHCFIANKEKTKNADKQVWSDTCGDQKLETFFNSGIIFFIFSANKWKSCMPEY